MAPSKFLKRILNLLNVFCISCHYLPQFYRKLTLFWENVSQTESIMYPSNLNKAFGIINIFVKSNSILYYPCLSPIGINKIDDIFNHSGKLLHWKDATDKFNLQPRDIMQWLSVCVSIPAVWKSKLN